MGRKQLQIFATLFLAGAILPLALAPFDLWPIAVVSLSVLFIYLQNKSLSQTFKYAAIYGFGLYIAGASWVYVSMYVHGGVSMAFAVLGTVLFCLFMAVLFALPFVFAALLPQSPFHWIIGLPAIWVISEWFRSWILTGFPWLYIGYSHTDTWLNGWAPIGGVLLLSYLTALCSASLAQLLQQRSTLNIALTSAAFAVPFASGAYLQTINWTQPIDHKLSVALVQPNVDQKDRWSPPQRNKILRGLLSQTQPHWGADIIIWPEGAIPALYTQAEQFLLELDQHAKQHNTALITGIPTNNNPAGLYYNSMLTVGDGKGQYNKTRLVPFGEYVPFETLIRGLNNFFDLPMSAFSLGAKHQSPLLAKQYKIATAICYEIAYPNLVAQNVRNTTVILTVSNDAWFGNSIGPQQHMQMARMRAIENAKPMMRGTNNGITALVDYQGKIYKQLPQFDKGVLSGQITPRTGSTPFTTYASWPIISLSLLSITLLVFLRIRKTKKENINETSD
mgnify:CR=1 FL=1